MTLKLEDEALDDVESAYFFFANHRFDYADHFRKCLDEDLQTLKKYNGFHPLKYGFHYLFSAKFRTTIYYLLTGDTINVVAILDQRFSPTRIREILTERRPNS